MKGLYACYTCVHSYYETDETVFCPDCKDLSNYEEITDEDIELFVSELNIDFDNFQEGVHQALIEKIL